MEAASIIAKNTPETAASQPDTAAIYPTSDVGEKREELTVRVPVMITKKMESDLRISGYTQEQIDKMTPQEAWDCLHVLPR